MKPLAMIALAVAPVRRRPVCVVAEIPHRRRTAIAPAAVVPVPRRSAVGAALTLGARRGGVLIPLLVLPLNVPILIFGVAALDAAMAGLSARPHIMFLAAFLLGATVLAPLAAAAALRQAME